MNAFTDSLDVLFADPNFRAEATYQGPVGAVPVRCIVTLIAPDESFGAGLGVTAPGRQGEIRVSEIAKVEQDGIVTIAGCNYRVREPRHPDDQRLLWRFGLAPVK